MCLRRAFSGLFKFSILRNIKTVINSRINSQAILTFITLGIFCTRSQSNTKDIEESSINHKRDLVLGLPFDTPFKANDMETFAICWRCKSSANNGKMSAIFLAPQLGKKLRRFSLDELKIDQSFIQDIQYAPNRRQLCGPLKT